MLVSFQLSLGDEEQKQKKRDAMKRAADLLSGKPTVSEQQLTAITKPLKDYAEKVKYVFFTHEHKDRANNLINEIAQAPSIEQIERIIRAEKGLYDPNSQASKSVRLSQQDRDFMAKAQSYNQTSDSGYYKALNNAQAIANDFNHQAQLGARNGK